MKHVIFSVALVLVLGMGLLQAFAPEPSPNSYRYSNYEVRSMCQKAIKERLTYPLTPRFKEVAFYDVALGEGFKTYVTDVIETSHLNRSVTYRYGCSVDRSGAVELHNQSE